MSLKRKASFPPNATPAIAGPSVSMDDAPPQYLHSRTRKRFRNDRPDDNTIYGEIPAGLGLSQHENDSCWREWSKENTLRWLYTAQQRQVSTPCIGLEENEPENETNDMNSEPLPTPETVDSRQQTLFKFFKPAQSSSILPSSHMASRRPGPGDNGLLQPCSPDVNLPHTASPSSRTTGTDMDMDMDTDSGSDHSTHDLHKKGIGGFGWMWWHLKRRKCQFILYHFFYKGEWLLAISWVLFGLWRYKVNDSNTIISAL